MIEQEANYQNKNAGPDEIQKALHDALTTAAASQYKGKKLVKLIFNEVHGLNDRLGWSFASISEILKNYGVQISPSWLQSCMRNFEKDNEAKARPLIVCETKQQKKPQAFHEPPGQSIQPAQDDGSLLTSPPAINKAVAKKEVELSPAMKLIMEPAHKPIPHQMPTDPRLLECREHWMQHRITRIDMKDGTSIKLCGQAGRMLEMNRFKTFEDLEEYCLKN